MNASNPPWLKELYRKVITVPDIQAFQSILKQILEPVFPKSNMMPRSLFMNLSFICSPNKFCEFFIDNLR